MPCQISDAGEVDLCVAVCLWCPWLSSTAGCSAVHVDLLPGWWLFWNEIWIKPFFQILISLLILWIPTTIRFLHLMDLSDHWFFLFLQFISLVDIVVLKRHCQCWLKCFNSSCRGVVKPLMNFVRSSCSESATPTNLLSTFVYWCLVFRWHFQFSCSTGAFSFVS